MNTLIDLTRSFTPYTDNEDARDGYDVELKNASDLAHHTYPSDGRAGDFPGNLTPAANKAFVRAQTPTLCERKC